ncbi:MAG: 30S ribosomal protein S6e [Desulfurococcaceae archaeon]
MPDYKIVISDPEAAKNAKTLKVKVIGDPDIEFTSKMKEQLELPIIKMSSKLQGEINAVHYVATIRMRRPDTGDKVKITGKIVIDNSIPENTVKVSLSRLIDLTGAQELEGEIFRATAWQIRISDERSNAFLGLKIGEEIDGGVVGLRGVKLQVTGGSDLSGFPMRPDISGSLKKRPLISNPPGLRPKERGERRRRTVRGNTVAADTAQINTKVIYV